MKLLRICLITCLKSFLLFTAPLITVTLSAQSSLPDSRRNSEKRYIYNISVDNLRMVYLKGRPISEDMLTKCLSEYFREDSIPKLPRGNYMIVEAIGDRLNFTDHTVDDLYFKIIPADMIMLFLYDSSGNIINNAVVTSGSKRLRFDKNTNTYNTGNLRDGQVIEIENRGVRHYIEISKGHGYYYYPNGIFKRSWYTVKKTWRGIKRGVGSIFDSSSNSYPRNRYTGFVVFSKPKYKPGETVKFKGYYAKQNGKPYNGELDIHLSNYPLRTDTLLTKLNPYRSGMYEYQFKLADSLDLTLDNYYNISLETKSSRKNSISGTFRYEEYELKGLNFELTTAKREYHKGDSVKIDIKIKDENDMAVYGGRIELSATPVSFQYARITDKTSFIPDTLWSETVDMSNLSQKEVIIPESAFPSGISFDYNVLATYLSADNEKITKSKWLSRNANDYIIDMSLSKGILTIKELYKGESHESEAKITITYEDDRELILDSVKLPYSFPLSWRAYDVNVSTKNALNSLSIDRDISQEQIEYKFYRGIDSVYLTVSNPANIPLWYSLRKDNREIANGYTADSLYYSVINSANSPYALLISYAYGDMKEGRKIKQELPVISKNIEMDISTPISVYPGQKTNVLISVTDKKGKPVDNVDITAYAYTSKFKGSSTPYLPIKGKSIASKPFANTNYIPDESLITNRLTSMTWEKWRNTMSLDTIEYYKFLYPEIHYKYTEPTPDGATLISPYVVIDGKLQGVHILWIDNRLHYFSQAQHSNHYIFPVRPGLHHLRLRTSDRDIAVYNVYAEEGMLNIVSADIKSSYIGEKSDEREPVSIASKLLKKEEINKLSKSETEQISSQMITVNNNFGELLLPNLNQSLEVPGYIYIGDSYYYLNHAPRLRYNSTLRGYVSTPILAGPFPYRNHINDIPNMARIYIGSRTPATAFEIEGGNNYTLYAGYQKIRNWSSLPFSTTIRPFIPTPNFKHQRLSADSIFNIHNRNLIANLKESNGYAELKIQDLLHQSKLSLHLNKTDNNPIEPYLILIESHREPSNDTTSNYHLFYGGTRQFTRLPSGEITLSLIFADTTSCSYVATLYNKGQNYLKIDSLSFDPDDKRALTAMEILNRNLRRTREQNPYTAYAKNNDIYEFSEYRAENQSRGIISGTVRDEKGLPVAFASVIADEGSRGIFTDDSGYFELQVDSTGNLEINFIGYSYKTIEYSLGHNYNIALEPNAMPLNEIIVTANSIQREGHTTLSYSTGSVNSPNQSIAGVAMGVRSVRIRGTSTVGVDSAPLIIVNGVPFNGTMADLDQSNISSMSVLNEATAVGIYGSRAAGGVIMIQTTGITGMGEQGAEEGGMFAEAGTASSMRRNFHDDAFWQPSLKTDKRGEASFEVTYPDDITNWKANFIAIGNKKQTDRRELSIASFKALAARLSVPNFAIRGDSLNVVGRISNHLFTGDSMAVRRDIEIAGEVTGKDIKVAESHTDYIPVAATAIPFATADMNSASLKDSITIAYSIKTANGYFDGEERKIPIFEQGMLQTYGDFTIINDTLTHTFNPEPELGRTTIYVETSGLEVLLREIETLDNYPYMCNEQMASKIKALLAKRQIFEAMGKEFTENGKINTLIRRLLGNRNREGLWGWWNTGESEGWISKQIIGALLDAKDRGYEVNLNTNTAARQFETILKLEIADLAFAVRDKLPYAKQELLDRLIILKRLDAQADYISYFNQIEARLNNNTTADRLKSMLAMSIIGMADEIEIDSLMNYSQKTLLGSIFWSNTNDMRPSPRTFTLPYISNMENTLMAYTILKNIGNHENELEKIRSYIFESRKEGSWQNTYESSNIINTIVPDMINISTGIYEEASMRINGESISKFPFTRNIDTTAPITIRQEGTVSVPMFVTTYQQDWNRDPKAESSNGFSVTTKFREGNDTLSYLTAGKVSQLDVIVNIESEANYVQIEVPIPAGCSYESKGIGYYSKEAHREHFYHKVVIFSNKLTKGEHTFTIDLIPRYTGRYFVNPAKVELMYFPTFYGNNEAGAITIR
jgi:Large extracellular alpha-helical protein